MRHAHLPPRTLTLNLTLTVTLTLNLTLTFTLTLTLNLTLRPLSPAVCWGATRAPHPTEKVGVARAGP